MGSSLPPGVFTGHTRLRCAPRVALQQWSHTSQPACRGAHLCLLSPPSHALPTPQPCCPHGRCLPPGLPWDVLARPRPSITSLPAGSAHAAPAPALSPAPLTRGSPAVGLAFLGPLHLHTLGCMACSLAPMCALGPSVGLPHADWSSPSGGKGDRKEGPILMRGHRGRSAACGPGRWRLSKKRQRRKSRSGVVTVTAGLASSQVDWGAPALLQAHGSTQTPQLPRDMHGPQPGSGLAWVPASVSLVGAQTRHSGPPP